MNDAELGGISAGARTRPADQTPTNLGGDTRRGNGRSGGKLRYAGNQELTEAELGGIDAGSRARQADQDPTNLDARTRRAGGRPDSKTRYAGDEEVTEL